MSGHQYFILAADGEPEAVRDIETWARWFEAAGIDGRKVGRSTVGDAEVSTAFLGMNHDFSAGVPMLFETMIFGGQWDQYQWRYTLRAEAQHGHAAIVAALRAGVEPSPEYPREVAS